LIFLTSCFIFPWIIGIFDAYNTAKRLKQVGQPVKKRIGCMVTLVIGILIFTVVLFIAIVVGALIAADYAQKQGGSRGGPERTAIERRL
jgi:heme A synthase